MLGEVLPAVLEFSDGTEDALLAAVTSQGQDPATLATFPLAPAYILYMATRCVETCVNHCCLDGSLIFSSDDNLEAVATNCFAGSGLAPSTGPS